MAHVRLHDALRELIVALGPGNVHGAYKRCPVGVDGSVCRVAGAEGRDTDYAKKCQKRTLADHLG